MFTCLHVYLFTSIYIKCCVSEFVPFCLSPGGHIILTHSTSIFHTRRGGGKHFCIQVGTNIFISMEGKQTFYDGGSYDDVDEESDVSEVSKLSAEARIFRGR